MTEIKAQKKYKLVRGVLSYSNKQIEKLNELKNRLPEEHFNSHYPHIKKSGYMVDCHDYFNKNTPKDEVEKHLVKKTTDSHNLFDFAKELESQQTTDIFFEEMPREIQKKYAKCYITDLSYVPAGIKCYKQWGRNSFKVIVPINFDLSRGRRIEDKPPIYFDDWAEAKDELFNKGSKARQARLDAIKIEAEEKKQIEKEAKTNEAYVFIKENKERLIALDARYKKIQGKPIEECENLIEGATTTFFHNSPIVDESVIKEVERAMIKKEEALKSKLIVEELKQTINNKKDEETLSIAERINNLGYSVFFGNEYYGLVKDSFINDTFRYNKGVDDLMATVESLEKQKEGELKKEEDNSLYNKEVKKAKDLGLPSNLTFRHITIGETARCETWVIKPDGTLRDADKFTPASQYSKDGIKNWEQILEGELVLKWSKVDIEANHLFTVVYEPESLTDAQKDTMFEIEENISAEWGDLYSKSGAYSPGVGDGWGLLGDDFFEDAPENNQQQEPEAQRELKESNDVQEVTPEMLAALLAKGFNK